MKARLSLLLLALVLDGGCSSRSALIGAGVGVAMIAGGIACQDCGQAAAADGAAFGDATPGEMLAIYGVGVLGLATFAGLVGLAARQAAANDAEQKASR